MSEHSASRDRWFFSGMAGLVVALILAGFAPTFYARGAFAEPVPLTALVWLHGGLGTLWVAIYAAQSWLVSARRLDWHRRLGPLGAATATVFVVAGLLVVRDLERRHFGESAAVLAAHVFTNVAPLCAFAALVAAGIWQRRVPARHKRLMLLAAVVLLPPAIGRLFGQLGIAHLNFLAYACVAFANSAYDLGSGRWPHAASFGGAVALIAIDLTTTRWLAEVGS